MWPGPGQRHARLTTSPTFNPLLAMTPGQALEQIAYICIASDPDEDAVLDLEEIREILERNFPIEYTAAKSKFDIETRKAIETFEQLDPTVRKAIFDHFGR